jgi:hypothetical protein
MRHNPTIDYTRSPQNEEELKAALQKPEHKPEACFT